MNNFFLLNEAINIKNYSQFLTGMSEISSVVVNDKNAKDNFEKHESIWTLDIVVNNLFSNSGHSETAIIDFLGKLKSSSNYYPKLADIDNAYPGNCNAFFGIDFTATTIPSINQIRGLHDCINFKAQCNPQVRINSIQDFWDHKADIFPNLEFCDSVFPQIDVFSLADDRFKLIYSKLEVLNAFTSKWKHGPFNYKGLGLDNSPDTKQRRKNTSDQRTFQCPNIGEVVFNLHIKWYFGKEDFRMYYHPNAADYKCYIGYVGNKAGIGF